MLRQYTKLYNSTCKLRFLIEEYPHSMTQRTYGSLLQQLAPFEEFYNKDSCNFSYKEAVDCLIGLKKKTYRSLKVAYTIIDKYVDWCLDQGYNNTGVNAFKRISNEDLTKYVDQIALQESYITRERLYEIMSELFNDIDRALLILLFEGARGKTEFEELRNFKKSDIHSISNTLTLTRNNGQQREIKVDDQAIDILLNAAEQVNYYKDNGEATGNFAIAPLMDTKYLLRAIYNRKNQAERMCVSSINTRFRAFRDFTGVNFLNPTLIFQSGLLEKCERIKKEKGEITSGDYKQIYRDLNLEENNWFSLKSLYLIYEKNKKSA